MILNGYQVNIFSGGQPLSEYNTDDENDPDISCWIPSVAGEEFTVEASRVTPIDVLAWQCDVYADGKRLTGHVARPGEKSITAAEYITRVDGEVGKYAMSFGRLKTSDGVLAGDHKTGSLCIQIYEGTVAARTSVPMQPQSDTPETVNEARVKAADMRVKPGRQTQIIRGGGFASASWGLKVPLLIATFTFRYRSMAVLQAYNYAPRDRIPRVSQAVEAKPVVPIVISDSDDDDEKPIITRVIEPKKRKAVVVKSEKVGNAAASSSTRPATDTPSTAAELEAEFNKKLDALHAEHEAKKRKLSVAQRP